MLDPSTSFLRFAFPRWISFSLIAVVVGLFSWNIAAAQYPEADTVLLDGNIVTMDQSRPNAEAIAIKSDRILAVGSTDSIKNYIGVSTQVIDLQGRFTMPGFIEGHAHFVGLGQSMMMLNLTQAKTWDDVVKQVEEAAKVAPAGEWIIGRGWHQSKWDQPPQPNVDGYPTDEAISKVSPNNPVMLTHASGHMSFANGYAMQLAEVDKNTQNPSGGEVLKDSTGKPTGVFRETAMGLIARVRSRDAATVSQEKQLELSLLAIELASNKCLKNGITSFQDAGSTFSTIDTLRYAADEKRLGVRLWVMVRDSNERMSLLLPRYKMIGYGEDFLTVRALKRSIDGALGPHGAWLLSPYSDMPTSTGLNTATVPSVTQTAKLAIQFDYQMCVHAIGDRANREVLDIYEKLFDETPSLIPRRWRIEHAQHLDPADIPRFGKMNIIASMQGVHCTSDAVFVPTRLGMKRSKEGAYVWQSLLKAGAIVTNGSDAPVENVDPIASFYATVTRQLAEGVTFFPEEALTREQALRSYTIDCAYAAFEETQKGSLVPGKLADIVVLSNDLINCPDNEIKDTEVLYTIVGGKIKYRKTTKDKEPQR